MRFLVTGGAGYIGSHLTYQLIENGHDVIVIDNLSSGYLDSVHPKAEFYEGDFSNQELLRKILGQKIDAIFHFAALVKVDEATRNPGKYYENNTCKTLNLLQVLADFPKTSFIFSSTAAVYGNTEVVVTENTPTKPLNAYGHSKLLAEQIIREMSTCHGFPALVLRYFNVAGSQIHGKVGQKTPNATTLIKVAAETACGKRPYVEIYGTNYPTKDGTCVRDFIHVEDLCRAHIKAFEYLNTGGEEFLFNLGYGHGYSVRQVLSTMQKISGTHFVIHEGQPRMNDIVTSIAVCEKAKKLLAWTPSYDDLEIICGTSYNFEKQLP